MPRNIAQLDRNQLIAAFNAAMQAEMMPANGAKPLDGKGKPQFTLADFENALRERAANAEANGDIGMCALTENAIGLNRQWMGGVVGGMQALQAQIDELKGNRKTVEVIEIIEHRPNGRQLPNGRRN